LHIPDKVFHENEKKVPDWVRGNRGVERIHVTEEGSHKRSNLLTKLAPDVIGLEYSYIVHQPLLLVYLKPGFVGQSCLDLFLFIYHVIQYVAFVLN